MLTTTIKAALVGQTKWVVFSEGGDLSELDQSRISDWTFTFKTPSTGSLVDTEAAVENFGAKRNQATGKFTDTFVATLAYQQAFAQRHIVSVSGPGVSLSGDLTRDQLDQIPYSILSTFVQRTDPTAKPSEDQINDLKAKAPQTPAGESQEQPAPSNTTTDQAGSGSISA